NEKVRALLPQPFETNHRQTRHQDHPACRRRPCMRPRLGNVVARVDERRCADQGSRRPSVQSQAELHDPRRPFQLGWNEDQTALRVERLTHKTNSMSSGNGPVYTTAMCLSPGNSIALRSTSSRSLL